MNTSQLYILLSIIVLVLVALLFFIVNKNKTGKEKEFSPLAGLAFALLLAGLFFGENRFIGYGLIGVGVILALIDMINKLRKQ
jgi:uncharacterized membrane protein